MISKVEGKEPKSHITKDCASEDIERTVVKFVLDFSLS